MTREEFDFCREALGIRELLDGPCSAEQALACVGCALVLLGALLTLGLLL